MSCQCQPSVEKGASVGVGERVRQHAGQPFERLFVQTGKGIDTAFAHGHHQGRWLQSASHETTVVFKADDLVLFVPLECPDGKTEHFHFCHIYHNDSSFAFLCRLPAALFRVFLAEECTIS